jgi:PAS domain-containing protein
MRQAMDQPGTEVSFEHRVVKQDGGIRLIIWVGEIVRDRDGRALHILGTVRATDSGA